MACNPRQNACKACRVLAGIEFANRPDHPHPNCKCKIEYVQKGTQIQRPAPDQEPVVLLEGLVTGDTNPQYRKVNGYDIIEITVHNTNPIRFSDITIDGIIERKICGQQKANLAPYARQTFTFIHSRKNISPWTFVLISNYEDAVIQFKIVGRMS